MKKKYLTIFILLLPMSLHAKTILKGSDETMSALAHAADSYQDTISYIIDNYPHNKYYVDTEKPQYMMEDEYLKKILSGLLGYPVKDDKYLYEDFVEYLQSSDPKNGYHERDRDYITKYLINNIIQLEIANFPALSKPKETIKKKNISISDRNKSAATNSIKSTNTKISCSPVMCIAYNLQQQAMTVSYEGKLKYKIVTPAIEEVNQAFIEMIKVSNVLKTEDEKIGFINRLKMALNQLKFESIVDPVISITSY